MVGRKPFAVTDVIVAELTAGARSDADARRIRRIADSGTFYAVRPLFDYETAADVYRACPPARGPPPPRPPPPPPPRAGPAPPPPRGGGGPPPPHRDSTP